MFIFNNKLYRMKSFFRLNKCKISGSHSGIHEEQGLLGYNAMLIEK
jgi:hypothetical protein